MNKIDKILKEADENGLKDEIIEDYERIKEENESLNLEIESLKYKNHRLQIDNSKSTTESFRKSNENLKEKNQQLNKAYKVLKRSKTELAHLTDEQLGVYRRLLDDYDSTEIKAIGKFPGENHPIFNHFNELANQYPNRDFLVSSLRKNLDDKKELINFQINTQRKNIDILRHCAQMQEEYPDTWEEEVDKKEANLFKVTTIDVLEQKIEQLEKDKQEVDKWMRVKNNIIRPPYKTDKKVKNNLYYEIFHEFDRLFDFCTNVGGVTSYKANIRVSGLSEKHIHSSLALELQKQLGLCSEFYSRNFYYSNGEGRLIPFKEDRNVLGYVQSNTTFVKLGKTNQYLHGNIIDSDDLFKKIPKYVSKVQYRNGELVGFNNVFYNITEGKVEKLNPQAPILPLKNTKTELYLNTDDDGNIIEIEDNAMKDIFNKCFRKEDKEALLAYIGCCLYDKGYTQRQESVFLLSRGNTGKGLSINEYFPTPTGWKQMKDIQVGDKLFDENGNICNVTYKSPTHHIDCYEITFENGFKTIVDKDHRWRTKTYQEKDFKIYDTETLYNRIIKLNEHYKYFIIESNGSLNLPNKELIVPPYTLGAWLGDGDSYAGAISNHINDNQIVKEIEKDGFVTNRTNTWNNLYVGVHGLQPKLKKINVFKNKHIPKKYLRASFEQRLSLLQGIMDTDGYISDNGWCQINLANKKLIQSIRELLFTLGIKSAKISETEVHREEWDAPRIHYRLNFKTTLPVFRLKRKLDKIPTIVKQQNIRYIKDIKPIKTVPTQCIQVDSDSHLFLATKEMIPTHNTTFIRAICEIFYNWESQLVTKLSDERFGFSMFADNDIIIIDEVQSAKKDFAEVLKNISTGSNMAIEKKGIDTINLPAENVPRIFFIGNEFSKDLYHASAGEGVFRRMLCIIPLVPIQSLGYTWADLTTQSCKQWLVQQATLEYIKQGLHKHDIPITSISDAEKKARLEMCTYPERFFIKEHFEVAYLDDGSIDHSERLYYDEFHDFVIAQIDNQLLEKTIQKGNNQTFIKTVKDVFNLRESGYNTKTDDKGIFFTGIVPKTEQAINYFGGSSE